MKKFLAILCCVALLLCGCGGAAVKAPTETEEKQMENHVLDGKKFLFIGDSFLFTGRTVLQNAGETEAERKYDMGYFYQLCKANGANVSVTNLTVGGTAISVILHSRLSMLSDLTYDYVVFSGGRNSAKTFADEKETLEYAKGIFQAKNPDVKFFYLITSGAHNISVKETFPIDVLNNLDKMTELGVTVVDWGKLVADIIRGEVAVPGATQTYDKFTFVHNKSEIDGFHPNQLSGYIVALMLYCTMTGESAVGQTYSFWNDAALHTQFNAEGYYKYGYTMGPSNYQDVFNSQADMKGIQQLVDKYIEAKYYMNYNFS